MVLCRNRTGLAVHLSLCLRSGTSSLAYSISLRIFEREPKVNQTLVTWYACVSECREESAPVRGARILRRFAPQNDSDMWLLSLCEVGARDEDWPER